MPVTVHDLIAGAKEAAQAGVPKLAPDTDLPPVLLIAAGDSWHPWAVPPNLRSPQAERELLGYVIPALLANRHAHAAVFSFTAWIKPALSILGTDPRSSLMLPGTVKDEAGEREQIVLMGVDRGGLLLHSKARLKRRAGLPPHLGRWEDATPLHNAADHTSRLPDGAPRSICRALLLGVNAVEARVAA
jgi:hypothetical protein